MTWYKPWTWGGAAYQGGSMTNPDIGVQAARPSPIKSDANIVVTDERAMMIAAVFACTSLKANTCATLPLSVYVRTDGGREPLSEQHYLAQLLKYRPNNYMTALQFRQAMFVQRVLWGNAYARIRRINGRPVALTPLKPELMEVERTDSGLLYKYSTEEGTREYGSSEILHIKGFSSDGVVGVSPLGYARETLGLSISADKSASKSVNGIARAVLELDDFPTDEQKERLREMYGGNQTVEFRDSLAIIPGGMKYKGVSLPPDDLQLLETRQFNVVDICRFFQVPAVLVDGTEGKGAWPASYEQQMQQFLTFTLKPLLDEFESSVTDALLLPKDRGKVFVEHKVDGLLRADSAGRAAFYGSALQNGWMTRAEVRQKENLPHIEGSDDLTVQVNMTNLEDLPKVQGTQNVE